MFRLLVWLSFRCNYDEYQRKCCRPAEWQRSSPAGQRAPRNHYNGSELPRSRSECTSVGCLGKSTSHEGPTPQLTVPTGSANIPVPDSTVHPEKAFVRMSQSCSDGMRKTYTILGRRFHKTAHVSILACSQGWL